MGVFVLNAKTSCIDPSKLQDIQYSENEKKRVVGFYNLNGEYKYDLNLVNFYKHLKEEDFPTWDDFDITYDNWIYSMTIEKSGQRYLSFFDKETFSFKDIVPDEFVATEIELKHN